MSTEAYMRRGTAHKLGGPLLDPPPFVFHSPDSFWNTKLEDNHPVIDDANNYAEKFANQCTYGDDTTPEATYPFGYWCTFNENQFSVPIYRVPADYPRVKVTWIDGQTGLPAGNGPVNNLQGKLDLVPVPDGIAQLEADGSDRHLAIYSPETGEFWEFWDFYTDDPTYGHKCGYAGFTDEMKSFSGIYDYTWGGRGTSLSLVGGVITMQEFIDGEIPHGLSVALPVITSNFIEPATRGDGPNAAVPGGDNRDAVPEGLRLRLPADYFVDPGWSKMLRLFATAARDYGITVVDKAGVVAFFVEDDKTVGTAFQTVPTSPWGPGISDGGPANPLNFFPWHDLVQIEHV